MEHQKFNSITEAHRAFGLPNPVHPLISFINGGSLLPDNMRSSSHVLGFYKISYKPKLSGRLKYGQGYYDFDEGGLLFAAPNQVLGNHKEEDDEPEICSLYTLLIHPDFFLQYPLAKKIRQYGFFSYSVNETLHLSDSEKELIIGIFKMIEAEMASRIDDFSHDVIITQIELLLNYANRFYKRQFITRKAVSNGLVEQLDSLLDDYFDNETSLNKGLPTVQFLADHINLTPGYISDMLRSTIGMNAQQYIHAKLIEKAKEKLSATTLSVSEVAYALGFEHPQSFNKLFKTKTNVSPLEFRRSFN